MEYRLCAEISRPIYRSRNSREYSNEFKNMFTPIINEKFRQYIIEYNELISNLLPIIDDALKLTKENPLGVII
ncbi:hypothetical protein HPC70_00475 [Flavobacterium psychrophilum]|nr:hypothetical protein HPC70_00475 [Flavobacterium psychrophilum]